MRRVVVGYVGVMGGSCEVYCIGLVGDAFEDQTVRLEKSGRG